MLLLCMTRRCSVTLLFRIRFSLRFSTESVVLDKNQTKPIRILLQYQSIFICHKQFHKNK